MAQLFASLVKFQGVLPLGTYPGHAVLLILLDDGAVSMLEPVFATARPIPGPKARIDENAFPWPP
jgi:hypothetical protein